MAAAQSVNDLTGKVLCMKAPELLKKLVSDRLMIQKFLYISKLTILLFLNEEWWNKTQ